MNVSRRDFLKASAASATLVCGGCFGGASAKFRSANETINVGVIGAGGQGFHNWTRVVETTPNVRIAALCDVDAAMIEKGRAWFSEKKIKAEFNAFSDYRKMLEKEKLDAVIVSTPDHTHAPAAIQAMKSGCHVYVEKPLVRTIWEARYFDRVAKEYGVVTQMGNHGSAKNGLRRGVEVLRSGILGDVTEVHVWTNRPEISPGNTWGWKQPVQPVGEDPIPEGFDWNQWLGTAPARPFKKGAYHRIMWRAFHDFGTGAFGDMACHTMNLGVRGLQLGAVLSGEAVEISDRVAGSYPKYSKVKLTYAARKNMSKVDFYWYDGYRKPSAEIMPQVVATLGEVPNTGCLMIGSKGTLVSVNDYGEASYIGLKGEKKMRSLDKHEAALQVPSSLPRAEHENQHLEFIKACRGEAETFSGVDHSVPFVEGMLIGCLAQRVEGKITWDAMACKSDNYMANALLRPYIRKGWEF